MIDINILGLCLLKIRNSQFIWNQNRWCLKASSLMKLCCFIQFASPSLTSTLFICLEISSLIFWLYIFRRSSYSLKSLPSSTPLSLYFYFTKYSLWPVPYNPFFYLLPFIIPISYRFLCPFFNNDSKSESLPNFCVTSRFISSLP